MVDQDGTHIGLDFQREIDVTFVSRNWKFPAQGRYRIFFSAGFNIDTDVYMII